MAKLEIGIQTTLIKQLFANASQKVAGGGGSVIAALDIESTLVDAQTGAKATAVERSAFRAAIVAVAADGVLTDAEIRQLLAHLEGHGLRLALPTVQATPVDLEAIDLGDFGI